MAVERDLRSIHATHKLASAPIQIPFFFAESGGADKSAAIDGEKLLQTGEIIE